MMAKKRKICNDFRVFNEEWTSKYFFIFLNNVPVCVICKSTVAACKKYNIARHYNSVHPNYKPFLSSDDRNKHAAELKEQLMNQDRVDEELQNLPNAATKASFLVAYNVAKDGKPFTDGEFVKKCMLGVSEIMCSEMKEKFESISLSRQTIVRRIEKIELNICDQLTSKIDACLFFSIALDESTDVTDTAQLLIFIRMINNDFEITEELLSMISLKGRTTAKIIYGEIETCFAKYNLQWAKLVNVTTDGAPNMVGCKIGVVARIKNKVKSVGSTQKIIDIHCIIHQFALCKDVLEIEHITTVVVKLVNWVRKTGLRHRQFQSLLDEVGTDHLDVLYHNSVRWLSLGKVFHRVFELKDEIITFLTLKENENFSELSDPLWLLDFAFCVDLLDQINIWNKVLQGNNQFAHNMVQNVNSFKGKIQLYRKHLLANNYKHFPTLETLKPIPKERLKFYAKMLSNLLVEINRRFKCLQPIEGDLALIRDPYSANIDNISTDLQVELIDLHSDDTLRTFYHELRDLCMKEKKENIEKFYQQLDETKYKNLRTLAQRMLVVYGSTYICEQTFSAMKHNKSSTRSRLTDEHLQAILKISTTHFKPEYEKLVNDCKQLHMSH